MRWIRRGRKYVLFEDECMKQKDSQQTNCPTWLCSLEKIIGLIEVKFGR